MAALFCQQPLFRLPTRVCRFLFEEPACECQGMSRTPEPAMVTYDAERMSRNLRASRALVIFEWELVEPSLDFVWLFGSR